MNNAIKRMEETPLVTIAIPFYNSAAYLGYSIQSVINQTYQNWELLLVDDGGQDGSRAIAERFASKDNRIRIIYDGLNKGLAARLNESVNKAQGDFYARMDDDDIMDVTRIEKQVEYLRAHPEVNVVGSSAMIIDGDNKIVRSSNMEGVTSGFIHPTVMGHTEWFRQHLYNIDFKRCQDKELWLRTAQSSKFYNIPEPLLYYREFGQNSLSKNLKTHKALRQIYINYRSYGKTQVWFLRNYVFTYIKDCVFILFATFGKIDNLTKQRKRRELPLAMWKKQDELEKSIRELFVE